MSLSNRLKMVMDAHEITQEQLAKLTKISQVSIQKILAGQTRDPKFILEIGEALDVDPYWLKFGQPAPKFTEQLKEISGEYFASPAHILMNDIDSLSKEDNLTSSDLEFLKTAVQYIASIRSEFSKQKPT